MSINTRCILYIPTWLHSTCTCHIFAPVSSNFKQRGTTHFISAFVSRILDDCQAFLFFFLFEEKNIILLEASPSGDKMVNPVLGLRASTAPAWRRPGPGRVRFNSSPFPAASEFFKLHGERANVLYVQTKCNRL